MKNERLDLLNKMAALLTPEAIDTPRETVLGMARLVGYELDVISESLKREMEELDEEIARIKVVEEANET